MQTSAPKLLHAVVFSNMQYVCQPKHVLFFEFLRHAVSQDENGDMGMPPMLRVQNTLLTAVLFGNRQLMHIYYSLSTSLSHPM
jgi:hypothetical protein